MSDVSFYFYDLETSGVNPRSSRIMQFAGRRTDADLNPVGEPDNILIKLHEDVLPEPDAVLITGITPQMTLSDGITEQEFFKYFEEEINTPGTIFVGFNSVRFDDEFMRFGLFRNFYDPYEWQWRDGRSRWDMLDVVRMTRALRPEGIQWPFASDGKPTNRLELLTSLNGLDHQHAHDAMSDVDATISVARMIKEKQPKLFSYLLSMRDKKQVMAFIESNQEFVYVSGRYDAQYEKLTVVTGAGKHPQNNALWVYDLRYDPADYLDKTAGELAELMKYRPDPDSPRLPIKVLQYNKCPAIAPLSVLLPEDQTRLELDLEVLIARGEQIRSRTDFYEKLVEAFEILNAKKDQSYLLANENTAESQLYDGFIADSDKRMFQDIQHADPVELSSYAERLSDKRLQVILPLYKARNFPKSLSDEERVVWEQYKEVKINSQIVKYLKRLEDISAREGLSSNEKYLIEELRLYAESVVTL